jgi:Protein of unknown function (DUF1488)
MLGNARPPPLDDSPMLTPTGIPANFDEDRKAIGFWMRDNDNQGVRIFVTCEGLWQLDPSQVRDLPTAFKQFDALRSHIEQVASDRHARGEPFDGEHEGRPVMILRGDDICLLAATLICLCSAP